LGRPCSTHDSMLKGALKGRIEGNRARGKKRLMFLDMIKNEKGDKTTNP